MHQAKKRMRIVSLGTSFAISACGPLGLCCSGEPRVFDSKQGVLRWSVQTPLDVPRHVAPAGVGQACPQVEHACNFIQYLQLACIFTL